MFHFDAPEFQGEGNSLNFSSKIIFILKHMLPLWPSLIVFVIYMIDNLFFFTNSQNSGMLF